MLSAIIASTGGPGTCTQPSVAATSVMLCATVNAVIVDDDALAAAHDQQQRQHEQQVIDAAQDVLDAEHQVGPGDLASARSALDDELRPLRQQALDLAGAVAAFDAHDHVGDAAGDAVDGERLPGEPAGALDLPALDVRAVAEHALRRRERRRARRESARCTARRRSPCAGTFHITS